MIALFWFLSRLQGPQRLTVGEPSAAYIVSIGDPVRSYAVTVHDPAAAYRIEVKQ